MKESVVEKLVVKEKCSEQITQEKIAEDLAVKDTAQGEMPRKTIKSFVRRVGRATAAQRDALDNHYEKHSLQPGPSETFNKQEIFGRDAKVVFEIGFGNGASLAKMAAAAPEKDFIGIEVHRPGIGHLLNLVEQGNLTNVRIMEGDAIEVLQNNIPDGFLHGVQLFFPDPWPKKRHHKRRIVQPPWVNRIYTKLEKGGFLHMATDWENYAEHMLEVLEADERFENPHGAGNYSPRPEHRPETKFERRGIDLGHGVWDLLYKKK